MSGGFPVAKKTAFFLLQIPADPEPHCLLTSSGHFAFVLRKLSGVEMEAERFIIARDVALFLTVQCLDWSRRPPIILYPAPYIIHALLLANLGWKLISPLHHEIFFYIFLWVRQKEIIIHMIIICHADTMSIMAQHTKKLSFSCTPRKKIFMQPVNHFNNFRGFMSAKLSSPLIYWLVLWPATRLSLCLSCPIKYNPKYTHMNPWSPKSASVADL